MPTPTKFKNMQNLVRKSKKVLLQLKKTYPNIPISPRKYRKEMGLTNKDFYNWKTSTNKILKAYYEYLNEVQEDLLSEIEQGLLNNKIPKHLITSYIFLLRSYDPFYRDSMDLNKETKQPIIIKTQNNSKLQVE